MCDASLIKNCAPTLAGIKTGSLFTCPCEDEKQLRSWIRQTNNILVPKGLRVLPLRFSEKRALIYIYRPSKLSADLSGSQASELLCSQGYRPGSCENCVVQLADKLRRQQGFPHEIGLFLGYPVEDVKGFMECGPQCCKMSGCWKVYGDETAAKKRFDQYKKCTRVYCDKWSKGSPLSRLTVPG